MPLGHLGLLSVPSLTFSNSLIMLLELCESQIALKKFLRIFGCFPIIFQCIPSLKFLWKPQPQAPSAGVHQRTTSCPWQSRRLLSLSWEPSYATTITISIQGPLLGKLWSKGYRVLKAEVFSVVEQT